MTWKNIKIPIYDGKKEEKDIDRQLIFNREEKKKGNKDRRKKRKRNKDVQRERRI